MNEEQKKQYTDGLARYRIIELEKWATVVKDPCKARRIGLTGMEICGINYGDCEFNNCFAVQVIKHAKGFL